MSTVDLIALGLVALTALMGFRRGLVVGVLSFGGLVIGFYLGTRLGPALVGDARARWLPLIAVGTAMVVAALGQALGGYAGRAIRRTLIVIPPLRLLDSAGGGFFGAALGLALCWAVGAVLLYLPGETELRRYAQESTILSTLNEEYPAARLIDTLAGIDPFGTIAGPPAGVTEPDAAVLDSAGVTSAALSVVRVIGNACGLGIEGSGWVAGPGLVVTNAHVVAGVNEPRVDRNDGDLLDARVVVFDKKNDIAVLRVPGLAARALRLAEAVEGTPGGMLGYPANGPYTETAVRVGRVVKIVGRDAFGNFPTPRDVTTIRGTIRSGNSGGPVVDARGRVITTVFAQRAGRAGGYGVPTAAVRAALAKAGTVAIETPCVER
ncbi:MarP family serine protease [Gaiella sp.]|uniref:MarP family serine protease n=1 Tax=Gaiella sp. TaxID=2663207 RepID=UPI0032659252